MDSRNSLAYQAVAEVSQQYAAPLRHDEKRLTSVK
jgi:hypothetical protein